jgi:hypothetical protein
VEPATVVGGGGGGPLCWLIADVLNTKMTNIAKIRRYYKLFIECDFFDCVLKYL